MAILLSREQPKSTTYHLNEQIPRSGWSGQKHAVDVWDICAFCEKTAVQQDREFLVFEST
jgi:hypothetical protein